MGELGYLYLHMPGTLVGGWGASVGNPHVTLTHPPSNPLGMSGAGSQQMVLTLESEVWIPALPGHQLQPRLQLGASVLPDRNSENG